MAARVHAVGDCERRKVVGSSNKCGVDGYGFGASGEAAALPLAAHGGVLTHHVETATPSPQRG